MQAVLEDKEHRQGGGLSGEEPAHAPPPAAGQSGGKTDQGGEDERDEAGIDHHDIGGRRSGEADEQREAEGGG